MSSSEPRRSVSYLAPQHTVHGRFVAAAGAHVAAATVALLARAHLCVTPTCNTPRYRALSKLVIPQAVAHLFMDYTPDYTPGCAFESITI